MNPSRVITASESGALLVAVFGELSGQGDDRTLPRPRMIVGILVFYGLLGLAASLGTGLARFCSSVAVVTFLVTLVGTGVKGTGQGGANLIAFLTKTTSLITGSKPAATPQPQPFPDTGFRDVVIPRSRKAG